MYFEALNAGKGDCLVLSFDEIDDFGEKVERRWIIDGGPNPVWQTVLLPRLDEFRGGSGRKLKIDFAVVSHIDDDHIHGLDKLVGDIVAGRRTDLRFEGFWFNAFQKVVGAPPGPTGISAEVATVQALGDDWLTGLPDPASAAVAVQSFAQGDSLAGNLRRADIPTNTAFRTTGSDESGFGDLVTAQEATIKIGEQEVTVLGPRRAHVAALRKAWKAAWAREDAKARKSALQALFGAPDASVPNLSSIVLLVKTPRDSKLLLTGDARGDDIVDAWEQDHRGSAGPVQVQVLKLPHHGSKRNTTARFLAKFPADHYVFSADGSNGNPDPETVEAVVEACGERKATLHFTNRDIRWPITYRADRSGQRVDSLCELAEVLAETRPGNWTFAYPDPVTDRITIELP